MVNFLAMIVMVIVSFGIGMIWYGPLFGKEWMRLVKIKKPQMVPMDMIVGLLITIVTVAVSAVLVDLASVQGAANGLMLGFLLWLGYVATSMYNRVLWERGSSRLFAINAGYYLVLILLQTGVFSVWY